MVSGVVRSLVAMLFADCGSPCSFRSRNSRRKAGRGGQFRAADASLGIVAAGQTETLEDRAMLDGDPYGTGGSMPPTTTTTSTTTTTPPATTTATSTNTTTTTTTGGTTAGTFLGSVSGGVLRPAGQEWFETFGTDPLSGVVAVHRDLPGGLALSYSSDTALTLPIITADTTWNTTSLPTGPLTATLKINGVTQSSVVIDQTGIQLNSPIRIALQATTPLATGKYDDQIEITAPMGMSSQTQTLTQTVLVENRTTSAFGKGWSVAGLKKLVPQTGGTLFVNGAGVREWFGSNGMAMPGMMASSPLVQQTDMSWRINQADGSYHAFDTSGRITAKVDSLVNSITYGWDMMTGLLTSVTDAFGRITTLAYSNGRLAQVTDYAGRFVVLTHGTDGQLNTISSPSSFQPGPWTPPVMTYGYNTAGLIATLTDPLARSTSLTYSFAGRLASAVLPGGAAWNFAPVALVGLVNTATGSGTTANPATRTLPATALATWTNPLGGIRQLAVDGLGNIVRDVAPDGSQAVYTRDANGRVLTITQPDPAGKRFREWVESRFPEAVWHVEVPLSGARSNGGQWVGTADLLLQLPCGGIVIVDHKSAPIRREHCAAKATEFSGQLSAYAEVLQDAGETVQTTLIHFPLAGVICECQNLSSTVDSNR